MNLSNLPRIRVAVVTLAVLLLTATGIFFTFYPKLKPDVSEPSLVSNGLDYAGINAVPKTNAVSLKSRKNAGKKSRPMPIAAKSSALDPEKRTREARKFAELFRAESTAAGEAGADLEVDSEKQSQLLDIKEFYGEAALLQVQPGPLGRLRGFSVSIPLENVAAGNLDSLTGAVEKLVIRHAELFGVDSASVSIESASFCAGEICSTKVRKKFYGLPAWDHGVSITSMNAVVVSAQGEFYEPKIASFTDPKLATSAMRQSIAKAFSVAVNEVVIKEPPQLGIARSGSTDFLAYKLPFVSIANHPYEISINAETGLLARRETLIKHSTVTASGTDIKGNTVNFEAHQTTSGYEMRDTRFPSGHYTEVRDFEGLPWWSETTASVLGNFGSSTLAPPLVQSSSADSGWDPAAVSALRNAKLTSDYYLENHSYQTILSSGSPITIGIREATENAAYVPKTSVIYFGVGTGGLAEEGLSLAVAKDVVGHEVTHGVIGATSALAYRGQSGALDEAFSDFMGAMVDAEDWLIGEDLKSPFGNATRNMANPADALKLQFEWQHWSGTQPAHMNDYQALPNTDLWDWGGVHIYSGIINRALYLLAEGLTSENLGASIGRIKTADLVFKTMTTLTQRASFDDAVNQMLTLAENLYGSDSAEKQAVVDAFGGVGLPTTASTAAVSGSTQGDTQRSSALVYLKPYYSQETVADADNYFGVYVQLLGNPVSTYIAEYEVGPINGSVWASDTRPTLVRGEDGNAFVMYRGKEGNTYLYNDATQETETLDIGIDIAHVALSQDLSLIVFSEAGSNRIYIYNYLSEVLSTVEVMLPSYTQGQKGLEPYYIDTLRFDPTSRFIIFDFAICDVSRGLSCDKAGYWSIGVLNVSDLAIDFPFPSQSSRYDVGFPTFSNLTDRYIAFDLVDNEADTNSTIDSSIYIYDRDTKKLNGIVNTDGTSTKTGHWGTPSFAADDSYLTFSYATDSGSTLYAAFLDNYELLAEAGAQVGGSFSTINPNFGVAPFTIPAVAVDRVPSLALSTASLDFGDVVQGVAIAKELCVENAGDFPINLGEFATSASYMRWDSAYSFLKEQTRLCSNVTLATSGATIGEVSTTVSILHDGENSPTPVTISGYIDLDSDSDGTLNYKDLDDDNDNILDGDDAFPLDATETVDTDLDGIGNNADTDDDGDGLSDSVETTLGTDPLLADSDADGTSDFADAFPLDSTETLDTDLDGIGNNTDVDDDGDGLSDEAEISLGTDLLLADSDADGTNDGDDSFPLDSAEALDTDSDGIGNVADLDDDGDGFSDEQEAIDGTDPLNKFSCLTGCFSFDIDNSLGTAPLTDGLLVIRHLFGFSGTALTAGATDSSGSRLAPSEISAYLSGAALELDIDGNGKSEALTDGLLLIRYLFGFTGDALINGALAADATRTTSSEIEAYVAARKPGQ